MVSFGESLHWDHKRQGFLMSVQLRPATPLDAGVIAEMAVTETEGLMSSFWGAMAASNETATETGVRQIKLDHGVFSWKNATIALIDDEPAGVMISEVLAAVPEPIEEDMHPIIRPIVKLQNDALETRFISLIAIFGEYRRQHIGEKLLEYAEAHAGPRGVSAISTNANAVGQEFFFSQGYTRISEAPLISTNWDTQSNRWYLLGKPET